MLLWVTFAIMTAAVLAALLWPVYRLGMSGPGKGADFRSAELAVYRDQLSEIDRDLARGLIGIEEARAARNEVSRRILAAAEPRDIEQAPASAASRRAAVLSALVLVPAVAVSMYVALGRPDLPGLPRAERLAAAVGHADFTAMVARVETHLAENPDDAKGWLVLAPAYRGMGRYGEAAEAFSRALDLVPASASLLSDYAEALVLANKGLVTATARKAFEQALEIEPGNAKALFYDALADRQDGKTEEALATWRAMLEEAPADAPWREAVELQVASLEGDGTSAPDSSQLDTARGEGLEDGDRQAMIRGMVEGLAQRLEQEGDDLQGWLRLARARMVLGEPDAAIAALRSAEQHFNDDPESLIRIAETRNALGLAGSSDETKP